MASALRLLLLAWLISPILCIAQQGIVISVADGDTFTMETDSGKTIKVRLYGIDCPEKRQDFGIYATQYTSNCLRNKTVTVTSITTDRFNRVVGIVTLNDSTCINIELLKAGLAWHYTKYSDSITWSNLESLARHRKIGLWNYPLPIPPWEYRKIPHKR